jgi:hypothetical protein
MTQLQTPVKVMMLVVPLQRVKASVFCIALKFANCSLSIGPAIGCETGIKARRCASAVHGDYKFFVIPVWNS